MQADPSPTVVGYPGLPMLARHYRWVSNEALEASGRAGGAATRSLKERAHDLRQCLDRGRWRPTQKNSE